MLFNSDPNVLDIYLYFQFSKCKIRNIFRINNIAGKNKIKSKKKNMPFMIFTKIFLILDNLFIFTKKKVRRNKYPAII